MDSNIKNCPHFWQVDLAGGNNIYCSNCGLSKTLTALIAEAKAGERKAITQAMLDALPEKKPETLYAGYEFSTVGKEWNQCRDQMETAIKKIGGSDENTRSL